jgi:hypothetical protein
MKNLLLVIILIIIIILLNNYVKEEFTKYGYQCLNCPWEGSVRVGNTFDVLDCKCPVGTYNKTTRWGPYGVYDYSSHMYFLREPLEGRCDECPKNTYKDNNDFSLECTRCPYSKKTSETGQQDINSCKCDKGKSGPDGDFDCSWCPNGTYKSVIGDSSCTPVPDNAELLNKSYIRCLNGYYKNTQNNPHTCDEKVCNCNNGPITRLSDCPVHGDSYCTSCNAGYELINNECQKCEGDKYKSTIDNTPCLDKPANSIIIQSPAGENIGFSCISPPCAPWSGGCPLQQYHLHEPTNTCVFYNYLTYYRDSVNNNHLANIVETGGNSITILDRSQQTIYKLDTTDLDYYVNNVNYGNNIYWSINQELIFGDSFNIKFLLAEEGTRELVKLVEFDVETSTYYSIKRFIVHQRRETRDSSLNVIRYNTKMEIRLVRTFRYQYLEIRVNQVDIAHDNLDTEGRWGFQNFNGTEEIYIIFNDSDNYGPKYDYKRFFKSLGAGTNGNCVVFRTSLQGVGGDEILEWETGSIWQIYKGYYLNI